MTLLIPKNNGFIDTSFRQHDSLVESSSPIFAFHAGKLLTKINSETEIPSATICATELKGIVYESLYVGEYEEQGYYTTEIDHIPEGYEQTPLRSFLDTPGADFVIGGRAMQILTWDKQHRFCGQCGNKTMRGNAEWCRGCVQCGLSCYPRLSPCVIMAIRKGDEILLAQRPGGVHTFYSVLAGFVEPGESAEQAVQREVYEEVGLKVKNIRYFSSQPWPFPGQLMIGYISDYESGELTPDLSEVQNAGWFHYENLPECPGKNTIAGKLIRQTISEISSEKSQAAN